MAIDFAYIGRILLTVLGLYLLSALFGYIQGWVMAGVSMKVTYRFRKDIAEKINRMPLRYFDGTNHGEVLSRITNDVDTISQTLNQSLMQIDHVGDDGDRRADHDAHHQLADDAGGAGHRAAVRGVHQLRSSSARRSTSSSSRTISATSTGTSRRCTAGTS